MWLVRLMLLASLAMTSRASTTMTMIPTMPPEWFTAASLTGMLSLGCLETSSIRYLAAMASTDPDVLVIGAGVSGLSSALVLLESGFKVTIFASDPPHRTTSVVAAALWGTHLVGPDERIAPWASATLDRFRELASDPATGIREIPGLVATLGSDPSPPDLTVGLLDLTPADRAKLPAGFAAGWRYRAPVIAMPVYLDYLVDQVIGNGGLLQFGQSLRSLAAAEQQVPAPVIVNCAGIGARALVADEELIPVRGQIVVVANPGLTDFFVGERPAADEITYIFPHETTVVLGGTEQAGQFSTQPEPATAARILAHCAEIEPRLAGAPVIAHRVGLRPARSRVRLERQVLASGRHVVHNYGHGGSGVTLSWGCAHSVRDEVADLLR